MISMREKVQVRIRNEALAIPVAVKVRWAEYLAMVRTRGSPLRVIYLRPLMRAVTSSATDPSPGLRGEVGWGEPDTLEAAFRDFASMAAA